MRYDFLLCCQRRRCLSAKYFSHFLNSASKSRWRVKFLRRRPQIYRRLLEDAEAAQRDEQPITEARFYLRHWRHISRRRISRTARDGRHWRNLHTAAGIYDAEVSASLT